MNKKLTTTQVPVALGMHKTKKSDDLIIEMVYGKKDEMNEVMVEFHKRAATEAPIDFGIEHGDIIEGSGETSTHIVTHKRPMFFNGKLVIIKPIYKISKDGFDDLEYRDDWYTECQFAMMATSTTECLFYQWSHGETHTSHIDLDHDWIHKYIPLICEFGTKVSERLNGFETDRNDLADKYTEAKDAMEDAKDVLEELKAQVIAMARGNKDRVGTLTVTKSTKMGSVQYKKIPELKDVNLDQYRGKPSSSWRIT